MTENTYTLSEKQWRSLSRQGLQGCDIFSLNLIKYHRREIESNFLVFSLVVQTRWLNFMSSS